MLRTLLEDRFRLVVVPGIAGVLNFTMLLSSQARSDGRNTPA